MKEYRPLLRFAGTALACFLIWFVLYDLWLKPDNRLDEWLTGQTAAFSSYFLNLLGYAASHLVYSSRSFILLNHKHLLGIAHVCNGQVLYGLFAGFILSFPGNVRQKIWFIPAGLLAIFAVNVWRCVLLSLVKIHFPAYLDFNHRYTFTLVMYTFIFGLWMVWVNRYSDIARKPVSTPQPA
jgi:exosortase family protein XrtF